MAPLLGDRGIRLYMVRLRKPQHSLGCAGVGGWEGRLGFVGDQGQGLRARVRIPVGGLG